ncbi:hypothetical protein [Halalkalibacter wakoensis]|nr:hypothetical protein [Halalkalibacter wakoensis]
MIDSKKQNKKSKKTVSFSRRDIEELMGAYRPTYGKRRGAWRQK